MTKHTPGPWYGVGAWVEHPDDDTPDICNCNPGSMGQDGRSYKEMCANATLIAAAPDLLAALRLARNFVSDSVRSLVETEIHSATGMIESPEALMQIEAEQDLLNQIEAVIEQATGGKA